MKIPQNNKLVMNKLIIYLFSTPTHNHQQGHYLNCANTNNNQSSVSVVCLSESYVMSQKTYKFDISEAPSKSLKSIQYLSDKLIMVSEMPDHPLYYEAAQGLLRFIINSTSAY